MAGRIWLFHGDDRYALAAAREKLERETVDPVWKDFNLVVLPSDASGARIVEALLAMPFGGGQRLVIVKEPGFLSGKVEDPSLDHLERLIGEGLPDSAVLLLLASKLDSRLKMVKRLQEKATVREFSQPKPWQIEEALTPWVEQEVGARKRRIAPQAVGALISATGGDRFRLLHEIEKLTTYAEEGVRITPEMVQALVSGGEIEVFALTDALAAKRSGDALVALNRLLVSEHPLKVAAAVVTVMRNWLRLKTLQASGLSAQAIAQAIGARSDFKVRKDLEAIRAWSPGQLERSLERLAALDWSIKSGEWPPDAQRALWEKAIADMLRAA